MYLKYIEKKEKTEKRVNDREIEIGRYMSWLNAFHISFDIGDCPADRKKSTKRLHHTTSFICCERWNSVQRRHIAGRRNRVNSWEVFLLDGSRMFLVMPSTLLERFLKVFTRFRTVTISSISCLGCTFFHVSMKTLKILCEKRVYLRIWLIKSTVV